MPNMMTDPNTIKLIILPRVGNYSPRNLAESNLSLGRYKRTWDPQKRPLASRCSEGRDHGGVSLSRCIRAMASRAGRPRGATSVVMIRVDDIGVDLFSYFILDGMVSMISSPSRSDNPGPWPDSEDQIGPSRRIAASVVF